MDRIRIGYFLEDIGQEGFLKALVTRVAKEQGLVPQQIHHEIRNATGGHGTALNELRSFLRDIRRQREQPLALLVVAIDGNCQGYQEVRKAILAIVKQTKYPGSVACAVPDPHIERWYLADPLGMQKILHADVALDVPAYKCQRDRYKQALRRAVRQTGVVAPLGGVEYGPEIASVLNFYTVGKVDTGFKHFIDELKEGLSPFARMREKQK
jgi:hypothetical protein